MRSPGGGTPESLVFIGPLVDSLVGNLSCVTSDADWGGFPKIFPTTLPLLNGEQLVGRQTKLPPMEAVN